MLPALSIIIPTHRRAAILRECLDRIGKQTIVDQLEVIVVSDGEDADITKLFTNHTWKFPVRFETIPKSQQGVARNRGVALASAERCLFIGDDIFVEPDVCEKHLGTKFEGRRAKGEGILNSQFSILNSAVLGFTTWDPALTITPVMRWLERTGWQFGYPLLTPYRHAFIPAELQHRFTYTSHISLPTAVARAHPFREDVSLYGWEDIEWGMRLRDAGVRLFYEPDAVAYHHHPLTMEDSLRRMETLGASAVHLSRIVPSLDRVPHGWKRVAYRLLGYVPSMRGTHARAFLKGILDAEEKK